MKPEVSEEIISGWRREFEEFMREEFIGHSLIHGSFNGEFFYENDQVDDFWQGYLKAKTSSHERILELENENSRLKSFCDEVVYGEDNPNYYMAMQEKLTKRDELLKRGILAMRSVCDLKGCDFDDIHEWLNDVEQLEQEK